MTCIGEPVSWMRLERYALGELAADAARGVKEHVDACEACRGALGRIEPIALPALVAPEAPVPWGRRWLGVGGLAAAVAAALLFLVLRPEAGPPTVAEDHVRVKGGEMTLKVVRERDGIVSLDAHTFRTTDRLKARITCTPAAHGTPLHADVVVFQGPAAFPVPPVQLSCGNDVTLPGAFRLTEDAPATICLAIGDRPVDRAAVARRGPRGPAIACVAVSPE